MKTIASLMGFRGFTSQLQKKMHIPFSGWSRILKDVPFLWTFMSFRHFVENNAMQAQHWYRSLQLLELIVQKDFSSWFTWSHVHDDGLKEVRFISFQMRVSYLVFSWNSFFYFWVGGWMEPLISLDGLKADVCWFNYSGVTSKLVESGHWNQYCNIELPKTMGINIWKPHKCWNRSRIPRTCTWSPKNWWFFWGGVKLFLHLHRSLPQCVYIMSFLWSRPFCWPLKDLQLNAFHESAALRVQTWTGEAANKNLISLNDRLVKEIQW